MGGGGAKIFERKMTGYASVTVNEQNFPEFSPELVSELFSALLKHTAVCSLRLTGLKILQNKHTDEHVRTHTCSFSTTTREAPFLPTQEGMMTLIIASEQARPQDPYQLPYYVTRQLYCVGAP